MHFVRGAYVWTGSELLTDAAVLIEGSSIKEVGPWERLREAYPDVAVTGDSNTIVMPGLINAHHHGQGVSAFQTGVRDHSLEPWIVARADAPAVDPYLNTLWAAIGLVQAGYTTVVLFQSARNPELAAADADARIRACRAVGMRVAFGLGLIQKHFYVYGPDPDHLPPRQGMDTNTYLSLLESLCSQWEHDPCVSIFPAPSGVQWVNDDTWEALGAWSRSNEVPLHTHCLESPYEAAYAKRAYEGGAVQHLKRLGALGPQTSLVHGVYLEEKDLDEIAYAGASLITNPGSNLRLRCGISPVLPALERGINVALGTDSHTLGDKDDPWAEMRLLLHLQRSPGLNMPALSWEEAVAAATTNAASVTTWGNEIGRLRPGAQADLSLFDYAEARGVWVHPKMHPMEVLVHRGEPGHLQAVIVGGRIVWEEGKGTTHVSIRDVLARLREHLNSVSLPEPSGIAEYVESYYRDWNIPLFANKLGGVR